MTGRAVRESIQGQPFNDVLNELHAHTFSGSPGESDPFTLGELEREYIAFALALYYQCGHCRVYHGKVVDRLRRKAGLPEWHWQDELVKTVLFLRTSKADLSEPEWDGWVASWRRFAGRIHHRHPGLACATAYAIGISRADEALMDMAFESLKDRWPDPQTLLGVIRDIDRVVVFMKAATSKNRTDPIVRRQLGDCGVRV